MAAGLHAGGWLAVLGEEDRELAERCGSRVSAARDRGDFTIEDQKYIDSLRLDAVADRLDVSDEILERLRRMCQCWNVELRSGEITSHRKFVGPLIVAGKRLVYPLLRALLRDTLREQRRFNAEALSLLAELASSSTRKIGEPRG